MLVISYFPARGAVGAIYELQWAPIVVVVVVVVECTGI
jgi:hypothetical protein